MVWKKILKICKKEEKQKKDDEKGLTFIGQILGINVSQTGNGTNA